MRLGNIAIESRKTHKGDKTNIPIVGLEHLISGEIRFNDYEVNTDNTFTKSFSKGQVLFGRRRAYLKKAAVAEFNGVCSGDITVIEAIPSKLEPELLPFIIQNDKLFDFAVSRSVGGLSPRVKWEDLSDFEICLPSLDEQKILADKLWAAYRLKESYKKLLAATDDMVKSQFIEMFGNPFICNNRWPHKLLRNCCAINPIRPKGIEDDTMVSFLPMQDIPNDGSKRIYTSRPYKEVKKGFTYCTDGDVLFAKITPCMENGKGIELKGLCNGIGFGSTEFHVLRSLSGITNSTWVYHLTKLDIFRKDAAKNMTGTGGQKRVPISYLENFKIELPPIDLQQRFATIAQQADKSKFELRKSIEAIDNVIKSLINFQQ